MGIVTEKVMRTPSRQQRGRGRGSRSESRRALSLGAEQAGPPRPRLACARGQLGTEWGGGGREAVVILHY